MLYKFAGTARTPKASGESSGGGKARAASPPAAAGASPSADSTAPPAAPDARQALWAANSGSAAEVYEFLSSNPDRATEIAIVAYSCYKMAGWLIPTS